MEDSWPVETLFQRKTLVQNGIGVIDLAATVTCEVAAEQRFEHERERVALVAHEVLTHDVCANPNFL